MPSLIDFEPSFLPIKNKTTYPSAEVNVGPPWQKTAVQIFFNSFQFCLVRVEFEVEILKKFKLPF